VEKKVELNLVLTVDQINVILLHLAKGTYNDVADIISEIHVQSKRQLDQANEPAAPE